MSKLERLQKRVVDTEAAKDAAVDAYAAAADYTGSAYVDYIAAWTTYRKALQELEDYLKEQDND